MRQREYLDQTSPPITHPSHSAFVDTSPTLPTSLTDPVLIRPQETTHSFLLAKYGKTSFHMRSAQADGPELPTSLQAAALPLASFALPMRKSKKGKFFFNHELIQWSSQAEGAENKLYCHTYKHTKYIIHTYTPSGSTAVPEYTVIFYYSKHNLTDNHYGNFQNQSPLPHSHIGSDSLSFTARSLQPSGISTIRSLFFLFQEPLWPQGEKG